MAYLSCPKCRVTIFDRDPIRAPSRCPRCASDGVEMELERTSRRWAVGAVLTENAATAADSEGKHPPLAFTRSAFS